MLPTGDVDCDDLCDAVELSFKAMYIMQAEFPEDCKAIWQYIQHCIFKLPLDIAIPQQVDSFSWRLGQLSAPPLNGSQVDTGRTDTDRTEEEEEDSSQESQRRAWMDFIYFFIFILLVSCSTDYIFGVPFSHVTCISLNILHVLILFIHCFIEIYFRSWLCRTHLYLRKRGGANWEI